LISEDFLYKQSETNRVRLFRRSIGGRILTVGALYHKIYATRILPPLQAEEYMVRAGTAASTNLSKIYIVAAFPRLENTHRRESLNNIRKVER